MPNPTSRPWHTDQHAVQGRPWGMFFDVEASLLFHLARDHFRGHGEIIDAGTFLGGSSYCLAKGLEDNARIAHKSGRIHAYDLFEIWHEMTSNDAEAADNIFKNYNVDLRDGETFFHVYAKNLGDLCRHIKICPGDITKMKWNGRPIEILFVDICKQLNIFKFMVGEFYRSLIPGISIVVHQDFHHALYPYIHIGHERMAKYFEVFEIQADTTYALRLIERIPDKIIDEVAAFSYSDSEKLKLMDGSIERLPEKHRHHARLAKATLLGNLGRVREARDVLEQSEAQSREASWDHTFKYSLGGCQWYLARLENAA